MPILGAAVVGIIVLALLCLSDSSMQQQVGPAPSIRPAASPNSLAQDSIALFVNSFEKVVNEAHNLTQSYQHGWKMEDAPV